VNGMTNGRIDGAPDALALFRLAGQVAFVTGAGSGIGRMAASVLAQAGAVAVCTDRDGEAAATVAQAIEGAGGRAEARAMDVADEAAVVRTVDDVARRHGRIDVLVNSAGLARRTATEEMPTAMWQEVVDINLTGLFVVTREVGRHMLAQRSGSVINLASIMGHTGGGLYPNPAYHASKGGVVNLTRALACEWGGRGVRVNDIAPTFIRTPLTTRLMADNAMVAKVEELTPLGRVGETDDLAGALLFLASPASAMVTGHSLAVDGGWLAR